MSVPHHILHCNINSKPKLKKVKNLLDRSISISLQRESNIFYISSQP